MTNDAKRFADYQLIERNRAKLKAQETSAPISAKTLLLDFALVAVVLVATIFTVSTLG